jgi:hypothetical protein
MLNQVMVVRSGPKGLEYLVNGPGGLSWDMRTQLAVRYENMREATRAAMRLPSHFRAFALPVPMGA